MNMHTTAGDDGCAVSQKEPPVTHASLDCAPVAPAIALDQVGAWLGRFFRSPEPRSVHPLSGGSSKLAFRARWTGHDVVLHVLPPEIVGRYRRTAGDMIYEAAFTDALRLGGVPVPRRYDTLDGRQHDCVDLGDVRYWLTAYDFVPGTVLKRLNQQRRTAVAHTLGQMHQIGRRLTLSPPRMGDHNIGDQVALRETALPLVPANVVDALRPSLEAFQQVANDAWHRIAEGRKRVRRFPTHGDFYQGNAVFLGNTLAAVIDFDECHDDGAWADLALTLESACRLLPPDSLKEAAGAFLDQYQRVTELDRPTFDLMIAFWRYRQSTGERTRLIRAQSLPEHAGQTRARARRRLQTLTAIERLGQTY